MILITHQIILRPLFNIQVKNGQINDIASFISKANAAEIKVAVAADILSLVKLEAPGKFGADVVVGTTQRFGIPMGYGGPHARLFCNKRRLQTKYPRANYWCNKRHEWKSCFDEWRYKLVNNILNEIKQHLTFVQLKYY